MGLPVLRRKCLTNYLTASETTAAELRAVSNMFSDFYKQATCQYQHLRQALLRWRSEEKALFPFFRELLPSLALSFVQPSLTPRPSLRGNDGRGVKTLETLVA